MPKCSPFQCSNILNIKDSPISRIVKIFDNNRFIENVGHVEFVTPLMFQNLFKKKKQIKVLLNWFKLGNDMTIQSMNILEQMDCFEYKNTLKLKLTASI